ncbi:hypothetical protein [Chitinophaga sancti]|uniref:hypothetical protein n=1 Tax=Chitinophaga sancti TaxID=1004 RepID=UPI003F7985DE
MKKKLVTWELISQSLQQGIPVMLLYVVHVFAPMTPEKVLIALYAKQSVPAYEEKVSHLGID